MLASMAKDQVLIDTYTQGKDVYAMVAEKLFGTPYEQNLEFRPELISDASHEQTLQLSDNSLRLFKDDEIMDDEGRYHIAERIPIGTKILDDDHKLFKVIKKDSWGVYTNLILEEVIK